MNGVESKKTSPWVYVVAGCGCLVLLAVLAVVGAGWYGMNKAKEFGEGFADPVKRLEKVRTTLGAEELPPGYTNGFALSIPFVMDMAMIGDTEPRELENGNMDDDDLFDRRGFVYMRFRNFGDQNQDVDSTLEELNDDYRADEELGQGTLEAAGGTVQYTLSRGTLSRDGQMMESYRAALEIDCPGDDSIRQASWFVGIEGTETTPEAPGDEIDTVEEAESEATDAAAEAEAAAADAQSLDDDEPPVAPTPRSAPTPPSPDDELTPATEEGLAEFLSYLDLCR